MSGLPDIICNIPGLSNSSNIGRHRPNISRNQTNFGPGIRANLAALRVQTWSISAPQLVELKPNLVELGQSQSISVKALDEIMTGPKLDPLDLRPKSGAQGSEVDGIAAGKPERCRNPRLERPFGGPNPSDRILGRPWTTPMIGILWRSR